MRRILFSSLLALAAFPAAAQSYGGGGVTVHQAVIPWQVPGQVGPNAVGCIGGIGYGVHNGKRKGGEGHFCDGPYANMAFGGAHFGFQGRRGGFWLTGYNTVGAGWIGVHGVDTGRFDGMFIYTRPSFGAGFAVGHFAALEGNLFANLPLNVLGVAGRDIDPQFTFPHVGVQATLLFGDFSRRRKPAPEPTYVAPPPPPPGAAPRPPRPPAPPAAPAAPAPNGPIRPGDLPPAGPDAPPPPPPGDSRPLAIPG
ncbi:MAG: hypothetical protein H6737_00325 [Alphaproteobacteria bacterium]|nr:hypothetical protein [Alphaproteobacteria bacterium]